MNQPEYRIPDLIAQPAKPLTLPARREAQATIKAIPGAAPQEPEPPYMAHWPKLSLLPDDATLIEWIVQARGDLHRAAFEHQLDYEILQKVVCGSQELLKVRNQARL
ncbi:MAG: hypothetical protein U0350_02505 [Caldilineaceae bacterium]